MMHHNKSFAFTLAEVLITLGIIGVVAAMTLPSLIAKHQEKQWVTAFLHTYSVLNNAYRMVQNENGTFEDWADVTITDTDGKPNRSSRANGAAIYNVMIKPYVQVNEAFLEAGNNSCIPEKSYQLNKEENPSFNVEMVNTHRPTVSLVSGECIVLGNDFGDFFVDVNGKKKPNTLGKDQFLFSFDVIKSEVIRPGYLQRGWTDQAKYCDRTSSNGWYSGISCGNWVLRNNNMDYLHISPEDVKKKWPGNPYSSDW